jgi:hypothetical protein
MKALAVVLVAAALLSCQRAAKQTFTGTITDDACGSAGHAAMRMGPTDAECTAACVDAHGAAYVLYTGKDVYGLSDQKTVAKFGGQNVEVVGALDAKTKIIAVESMAASK